MLEDDSKTIVKFVFKNNIFLFIYNTKKTIISEFSEFGYFDISNF